MASDLIFEIGTEELPASSISPALESLASAWSSAARAARLGFGEVQTHGTPRRLALLVKDVVERAEDVEEHAEGPWVSVAFDAQGLPTKAAEGFARKFGLSVDQLQRVPGAQGERLVAVRRLAGQPAGELLAEILPRLIAGIPFRKSMRWGEQDVTFVRPVRWICALLGGEIVRVRFGDVESGGVSYGHRFLAPGEIRLTRCDEYLPKMRDAFVLASIAERRERVTAEIDRAAREGGGRRVDDPELVDTITGLVEWPSGVLGSFDADALDMPREVLVSEMRGHQKYASVEDAEGRLLPRFVAVANTPVRDVALSRVGYERVLRARLADARFFFDEDRQKPLADRVNDLRRVTFQEKLGSLHDKTVRIIHLAQKIAEGAGYADTEALERAAILSKADLTTGMVGEFPDLQGAMGREYARASGERDDVAVALFEHYLPRGAHDALPAGELGALIGIADRLDTIAGIFAIGKSPTGATDPFALRRACLGVIRIVLDKGWHLHLSQLVDAALDLHYGRFAHLPPPTEAKDAKGRAKKPEHLEQGEARAQVLDFFKGRVRALWTESNAPDVVEAVIAAGVDDLTDADERVRALSAIRSQPDFVPLAIAFGRASNIIEKQAKDLVAGPVDPGLFQDEPERGLYAAVGQARAHVAAAIERGDYGDALHRIAELRPAVDLFFDKVLVMAEQPPLKENRLRLVQSVQQLFAPIADFSRIQTK